MALGEVHPGQAEVELGAEELGLWCGGRRETGQQVVEQVGDPLLVVARRGVETGVLGQRHGNDGTAGRAAGPMWPPRTEPERSVTVVAACTRGRTPTRHPASRQW